MGDCIFCNIAQHAMKADIVFEDNDIIAFRDISPQAPVHILLIPKKHIPSVNDMTDEDIQVAGRIYRVAKQLAEQENCGATGYRIVVNNGADAGQAVAHLHFHLLGGRKLTWPPG